MSDTSALSTQQARRVELPGQAPAKLTNKQAEEELELSELVPFDNVEASAIFKGVQELCDVIEELELAARTEGNKALADRLRELDASEAMPFGDNLTKISKTIREAHNGKAMMTTYWKLQLLLAEAYQSLPELWLQVATMSDKNFQAKFKLLESYLKSLLLEVYRLPFAKHVNRISLVFEPDVASAENHSLMDTVFDIAYGLPSTITGGNDRSVQISHWRRGTTISFNSALKDMSAELKNCLGSIPWGARLSQARKKATVERFKTMSEELSSEVYSEVPRMGRDKVCR